MDNSKKNKLGVFLAIFGGVCWGFSGICGQFLFEQRGMTAKWLVSVRLLSAGLILVIYFLRNSEGRNITKRAFTNPKDLMEILCFSIFGMGMCQFTYFSAVEASNAGTATVIQYTSPIIIMLYGAAKARKMPTIVEIIALVMTVVGTFLLATHGQIGTLAISVTALVYGLLSSLAAVFYNLIPIRLINKYNTIFVTGWGMFIGGLILCVFVKPWIVVGTWDIAAFAAFATIIIVGTIVSFISYLKGVQLIGATKASLFGSSEPVVAAVLSAVVMDVAFSTMDVIGLVLIIVAVTALSLVSSKEEVQKAKERKIIGQDALATKKV